MNRNWGTGTRTHWRGRFYERNIKSWVEDTGNVLFAPFKFFGWIISEIASLPWWKFFKVTLMTSIIVVFSYGTFLILQFIQNKNNIVESRLGDLDKELQIKHKEFLKKVDEDYAIQIGKLEDVKNKTIEVEARMSANGLKVPAYIPKKKADFVYAERRNGTGKSLGIIKVWRKAR